MLKLDELLTKKKEPAQILDLSKCVANNKDELKRLLEKVPEYKIRPEKVRVEEVEFKENKKIYFKVTKKELKKPRYPFANPIPIEMRSLKLDDLCNVDIPWKMLTSLRPKTKIDEDYFSRVIDIGKLTLATRKEEKSKQKNCYKRIRNRNGVIETRVIICSECGEEFCLGSECKHFSYDIYERIDNSIKTSSELFSQQQAAAIAATSEKVRKKSKKKCGKKLKKRRLATRKKRGKSSNAKKRFIGERKKNQPSSETNKIDKKETTIASGNAKTRSKENTKRISKSTGKIKKKQRSN